MANYVKFLRGTPDQYTNLRHKDADTLYFVSETDSTVGKLYIGEKTILGSASESEVIAYLQDLQDVNIENAIHNDLLGYDALNKIWIPMSIEDFIGAPATDDTEATGIYAALENKANKSDVYTKEETDLAISTAIADGAHLKRKIVADIAEIEQYISEKEDEEQYIFMIAIPDASGENKYQEYIVIDGKVEQVGSWQVDLSDYAKKEEVQIVQTQVQNLEKLLNGYENEDGTKVPSNFVTRIEFNTAVGNLEELLAASQNIVSRIEILETNMQWQNIEE